MPSPFHYYLTLPMAQSQGGSSFTERTCPMTNASHNVEALSPEAFAALASSLFPCAPRYSRESLLSSFQGSRRPRGVPCASAKHSRVLRCKLWSSLTNVRSCFSPKERFPLEPAETRLSCHMCYRTILSVAHKTGNVPLRGAAIHPLRFSQGPFAAIW